MTGLVEVMGGQDNEAAPVPFLGHHIEDELLARQIEAGDRLVEQEAVGIAGQCTGHQDPLTLSAGQLAEGSTEEIIDREPGRGIGQEPAVAAAEPAEQATLPVSAHA